jgi:type I restriction enzyme S subunit
VREDRKIPMGWEKAPLNETIRIIRGISFPSKAKSYEYSAGRIAILRTGNIQRTVEWDDLWFVDEKYLTRKEQILQVDDILISNSNSFELLGKVAQVQHIPYKAAHGTFIVLLRVPKDLHSQFIYYYPN